jgi:methylmalonyl-CoA/ethylmalonyl-CoA epimerase
MPPLRSLNTWGLTFHHLGLAAEKPEAAACFLMGLGYRIGPMMFDPLQNVHVGMCTHDHMPDVEIIAPAEGQGPLDKLLSAARDGLVYHMCYTSADLDSSLAALESEEGLRVHCVSDPKKTVLFAGKPVSFYLVSGVGLIEIIEE